MQIPLNQFEQIIDGTILKRGLSYYENGAITDFVEVSNGIYEASVSGSKLYIVYLEVKNNEVTEHYCDCAYDMGPVCKHIAATIFYLLQDELQLNMTKTTGKKKAKSFGQQIKEILKTISHKELIAFVEESTKKDKEFRNYFLASFGHLNEDHSKALYQKQLHSSLQTAKGRNGWIGWHEMKFLNKAIQPFLENIDTCIKKKNFEAAFLMSTALMEEMTKAFDFADDSSGDIGYFIHFAGESLIELTKEKLPAPLKQKFFEYCTSSFKQKIFKDWDWHLDMMHLASQLVEKESDADIILDCLDAVNGNYEIERAQSLKIDLLRRFKDEKEVEEFIETHISNPEIRKKEIERAFELENFERAISLANDGIQCDMKDKPGLVKTWYNWLLKVAQVQKKDTQKIIEYARYLFIDNFHPEQDYYQILKDHIEIERWPAFLEEIIIEISSQNRWGYSYLIRKIYIEEAWWDRLFLMLKQNPSLRAIQEDEKYLAKDYAPQLVALYNERIIRYVEEYIGRKHYQKACTYLRKMKKLGGNQQVDDLIVFFKKEYPQRKALMDELSRV